VSELDRDLVALAHDFAEREIRPVARHHDETEELPWDVYRKAAAIGLTCYDLPETFGGGGVESVLAQCLIAEELSWGDGPIANAITSARAHSFGDTDMRALYRASQSYRRVVVIVTSLILVALIIGLAEGVSIGGGAVGTLIYVVVSVTLSGGWLGIILWGIAVIGYRRPVP
jgi:alkylation response protein AidB-like acyl-CoA dehydrogenase